MLRFKDNVRIKEMSPALVWILTCLCSLSNKTNWIPEITITSINDSTHMEGSKHYINEAVDIRSHTFVNLVDKRRFMDLLKMELNQNDDLAKELWNKFTVIIEDVGKDNEHIHVQVVKGMNYP